MLYTNHIPVGGLRTTGVTDTNAEWLASHPGGEPRVVPQLPADLAGNAAAATVHQHALARSACTEFHSSCTFLKGYLLSKLSADIQLEMFHVDHGHSRVTVQDIVQHVSDSYGVANAADIMDIDASLDIKFTSDGTFSAQATALLRKFNLLNRVGQPKSNIDQMWYLEKAISNQPALVAAAALYKQQTPLVAARTCVRMIAFIRLQAPNLVAQGNTLFAGAVAQILPVAVAPVIAPPPVADAALQIVIANAVQNALANLGFAGNAVGGRGPAAGRGGRGGRGGPARGRGADGGRGGRGIPFVPLYCFQHGYGGHSGAQCNVMANDATYTAAMHAAQAPGMIGGFQGHA
jgi:hypothetical protein